MKAHQGGVPPFDLIGQKYNRLTVSARAPRKGRHHYWHCVCECGREVVVKQSHLRDGRTKSCGCFAKERVSATMRTHGETCGGTIATEYQIWHKMKDRCLNSDNPAYPNYGARGIKICDRWLATVENFIADMGRRPSPRHSLDRKDNDGNYCPSNCRWATRTEQSRNRRSTRKIEFGGEVLCASEVAERIGMKARVLNARLRKGWSLERALSDPVRQWPKHKTEPAP